MMKRILHVVIGIAAIGYSMFVPGNASPAQAFKTGPSGHKGITEAALKNFTASANGQTIMLSDKALQELVEANEYVDTQSLFGLKPGTDAWHFDDEQLNEGFTRVANRKNDTLRALKESTPNGKSARKYIGQALHTIQDFYAHSNWVELNSKGRAPLITWGETAPPNPSNPSKSTQFCEILKPYQTTAQYDVELTSGYYPWDPQATPLIKCAHGQGFWETFLGVPTTQGIAKDRGDNYQKAKDAANVATLQFLTTISQADGIRDNVTRLRALLRGTPPLVFVIDDSGSMSGEIAQVKSSVKNIISRSIELGQSPEEYVLVRFNDPQVGPTIITADPEEFLNEVNAITVGDGGDCPELANTALLDAIDASAPDSVIFTFTDASAKDADLFDDVIAAANDKDIAVIPVISGSCGFAASGEPSASDSEQPAGQLPFQSASNGDVAPSFEDLALASDPSFAELAQQTGGILLSVSPSEINKVFDLVEARISTGESVVAMRSGILASTPVTIDIPVDNTISRLSVNFTFGNFANVTLKDPAGTVIDGTKPNTKLQSLTYARIYTINQPASGVWKLQISGSGSYAAQATGNSSLQPGRFEFVQPSSAVHADTERSPGNPVANIPQQVQARLVGDVSSANFQLVGDDGSVLQTVSLVSGSDTTQFAGTFSPPARPFRVLVTGQTASSQSYQRLFPTLFGSTSLRVILDGAEFVRQNVQRPVLSGQIIPLRFGVENLGPAGTFSITASSGYANIVQVRPVSLTLATGISQTVVVTVTIPPTRIDRDVAVSVVAANTVSPSVSNNNVVNLFVPGAFLTQLPGVSRPPEAVPFNWIEASDGRVVAKGIYAYEEVDLPFPFKFFGKIYDKIFVSSNGFISFDYGSGSRVGQCAPSRSGPNSAIYALWGDFSTNGGANGSVYVKQIDPQTFVVQWNRVKLYNPASPQTFQAVLRTDNSVTLQYLVVDPAARVVVGYEDRAGTSGLSLSCPGIKPAPASNTAIQFSVP